MAFVTLKDLSKNRSICSTELGSHTIMKAMYTMNIDLVAFSSLIMVVRLLNRRYCERFFLSGVTIGDGVDTGVNEGEEWEGGEVGKWETVSFLI